MSGAAAVGPLNVGAAVQLTHVGSGAGAFQLWQGTYEVLLDTGLERTFGAWLNTAEVPESNSRLLDFEGIAALDVRMGPHAIRVTDIGGDRYLNDVGGALAVELAPGDPWLGWLCFCWRFAANVVTVSVIQEAGEVLEVAELALPYGWQPRIFRNGAPDPTQFGGLSRLWMHAARLSDAELLEQAASEDFEGDPTGGFFSRAQAWETCHVNLLGGANWSPSGTGETLEGAPESWTP